MRLKYLTSAIAAATLTLSMTAANASEPVVVTSGADAGEGSLRAALQSGATRITIGPRVTEINLESTLTYTGTAPLKIFGQGQVISPTAADADFTLLEISNGANTAITGLQFVGAGFDFDNPGTGKGIFVSVPQERSDIVRLELTDVTVRNVANHGIHVSDCTLGDDCGAGSGGAGDGSPASIHAILSNVEVIGAGNGKFDADGVRIDERNVGSIVFEAYASTFMGVGADGVELDEGNDGDVIVTVRGSVFDSNGAYCLPVPLDLSQPCVEDDDGELVLDLDDGFDIDEAGPGSLLGSIATSTVIDNLDEGLDFDEEGDGGVDFSFWSTEGMGNGDEAVKVSSANAGFVVTDLRNLTIMNNGNDGIELEAEDGDAEVHVRVNSVVSTGNDGDGLKIAQENSVDLGTVRISGDSNIDSLDLENIEEL